jgi:hypothetical protein
VAWAARCFQEFHACFFGGTIPFFGIAFYTSTSEILPRIGAGTGFWYDVVKRQWCFGCAAILALVVVAAQNIFPRKFHLFNWNVNIAPKPYNAGTSKNSPDGAHFSLVIRHDNFRFHQKKQSHRFFDIADAYRFVALI